uniref:Uncharacterized protein n=1 Tax=Ascaris lumbricoides TaxID=6252 RepID=A0A0M3HUL6_ASCLU
MNKISSFKDGHKRNTQGTAALTTIVEIKRPKICII